MVSARVPSRSARVLPRMQKIRDGIRNRFIGYVNTVELVRNLVAHGDAREGK